MRTCSDTRAYVHRAGARSSVSSIIKHHESRQPLSIPGQAPPRRRTDGQTDRPCCVAPQALPGRQMDGQATGHWGGWTDGQCAHLPGTHALPASSILCKTLPKEPEWEAARPRGSRRVWVLSAHGGGSQQAGAAGTQPAPQLPHAASTGLIILCAPFVHLIGGINPVEFTSTDGGRFPSRLYATQRAPPCTGCRCAGEPRWRAGALHFLTLLLRPRHN